MSRKKQSPKVIAKSAWWCETCQSGSMSHQRMLVHLTERHGLNTDKLKCQKRMISHVDADEYFSTRWEVLVGDIKLICSEIAPRPKDDTLRR